MREASAGQVGLARALSKLGICSRSDGERLIRAGQVRVDGQEGWMSADYIERVPE